MDRNTTVMVMVITTERQWCVHAIYLKQSYAEFQIQSCVTLCDIHGG
jgi:hypothetical protein